MTTPALPPLEIPSQWPQAVRAFWDLDESESISPDQWETIVDWLHSTRFNERSYLAGEAAAVLIRDRAPPEFRSRLWVDPNLADDWLLHFCIIALEHDRSPQYRALLQRALQSSHEVVRRMSAAVLAK